MATTKITSPDLFNLESLNSALKLPSGTTAQRPTSPSTGEWRYNTTTNLVEFWDGGAWRDLQSEDIPPIPSEHFNTVLYTGNGSTQSITGVGFKPDFVWIKPRSFADNHALSDSTRGVNKSLASNTTSAEQTLGVTSFDADGFSLPNWGNVNQNGATFVAWCWKAGGGTTSSNTDGTITSDVQANTKAGFSLVKFTGTGANGTVGHGLGVAPEIIIFKNYPAISGWKMFTNQTPSPATQVMELQDTSGFQTPTNPFNSTLPTSSVFSLGTYSDVNASGGTFIAYCFASVAGYSKIGSYTGNGSTNGPIVNTGFEPAFLMTKQTNTSSNWVIVDNKRSTTNPRNKGLRPNTNDSESTVGDNMVVDFLTNGFQLKQTSGANDNGGTFLYIAFASDASAAPALADSFANKLWTGNDGTNVISGLGFQPSFVWIKRRVSGSESHALYDMLRGINEQLSSDSTAAQVLNTAPNEGFSSFDTNGFTLGNNGGTNRAPNTYVGWSWKANSIPTINTDGTIQSIVSANANSGFSIVQGTASGGLNTVNSFGHGLGVKPDLIIIKSTTSTDNWYVYNSISGAGKSLYLNDSAAEFSTTNVWANTEPTASVFSIKDGQTVSVGATFITYCFKSTAGFSKIGSYVGDATSNRAITGLGFAPSWVMIKNASESAKNWAIWDSARGGALTLFPNTNGAEANETGVFVSLDSDGFTVNQEATANGNGSTMIYMAFKENPTPMPLAGNMSFLVVAGGGGGGFGSGGGGAGAGGLRTSYGGSSGGGSAAESDITLAAGTYTITIGAGGTGGIDTGNVLPTAGANSTVSTITSIGGGYGGSEASGSVYGPSVGGSGAGAIYNNTYPGSAGTANQGSAGGNGYGSSPVFGGGGGGGASAAGATASGSGGGLGGDGLEVSITGTATYYAGGGGGDTQGVNTTRAGGSGGGGTGGRYMAANDITTATGGTANTGGGGGGGTNENDTDNGLGGPGGSGVVILRLATSEYSGTTTGSPTVTTDGTYTILTYTGSGTYVHS